MLILRGFPLLLPKSYTHILQIVVGLRNVSKLLILNGGKGGGGECNIHSLLLSGIEESFQVKACAVLRED